MNGTVLLANQTIQVTSLTIGKPVTIKGQDETVVELFNCIAIKCGEKLLEFENSAVKFQNIRFKLVSFQSESSLISEMEENKQHSNLALENFMFIIDHEAKVEFSNCSFEFPARNNLNTNEVLAGINEEPFHQGCIMVANLQDNRTVTEINQSKFFHQLQGSLNLNSVKFKNVLKPVMVTAPSYSLEITSCSFQNAKTGAIFIKEPNFFRCFKSIFVKCSLYAIRVQVSKGFAETIGETGTRIGLPNNTQNEQYATMVPNSKMSDKIQNNEEQIEGEKTKKNFNLIRVSKIFMHIESCEFSFNEGNSIAVVSDVDPLVPLKISLNIEKNEFKESQGTSVFLSGLCSSTISVTFNKFLNGNKNAVEAKTVGITSAVLPVRIMNNSFVGLKRSGVFLQNSQVIASDNVYSQNSFGILVRSSKIKGPETQFNGIKLGFNNEQIKNSKVGISLSGYLEFPISILSCLFQGNDYSVEIFQKKPMSMAPGASFILGMTNCTFESDEEAPVFITDLYNEIMIKNIHFKNKKGVLFFTETKEMMSFVHISQENFGCFSRKPTSKLNGLVKGPWGSKNLRELKGVEKLKSCF